MKKKKSSEQKIKFFEKEVLRFINIFGLNDWEIYIEEEDDDADIKGLLICDDMSSNRIATIRYSIYWINGQDLTDEEITKTAFHEVMELLLTKLRGYSNNKEILISEREVDEEIHRIIRTMENTILKLI